MEFSTDPTTRAFQFCTDQAIFALNISRQYLLSNKNRNWVVPYIGKGTEDLKFAEEMFDRVDSGDIKHHAEYATEQLYTCAYKKGMGLSVPRETARQCFAKVDVPYFLYIAKEQGKEKERALAEVIERFPEYPADAISKVADGVFPNQTYAEYRRMSEAVFWLCMYP